MVLPLYLALTRQEMAAGAAMPDAWGWMACHFSPDSPGLCDLPEALPPGAMLILNDRLPCRNHDPDRVAAELTAAVKRLKCESVLLDLERRPEEQSLAIANALFEALPCPVAAPPEFVGNSDRSVFLPPCPLHVPLAEYLRPWQGREIWLDTAPRRETITVTGRGTRYGPDLPADRRSGGHFDDLLQCRYLTEISDTEARFILFDTPQTLAAKLDRAAALGVSRAVGLFQELAALFPVAFCLPLR